MISSSFDINRALAIRPREPRASGTPWKLTIKEKKPTQAACFSVDWIFRVYLK